MGMPMGMPGFPASSWQPSMGLPPMVMPYMPPTAFLQEMSETFQSEKPVSGCDCQCSNHDKHEEAMWRAQQNAMDLVEYPDDEVA